MTEAARAILLDDLPAAEARALLERYVSGRAERLETFMAEVRRRGGPADSLDESIESLVPLWSWFLAEHRPRRWFGGPHRMPSSPTADAVMRAGDPPWWYDFHPQFAQEMGPYLARLVTGLAASAQGSTRRCHAAGGVPRERAKSCPIKQGIWWL